ncbi:MAG: pyridoxamine 5'-phosphate oxidase family protein [Patescibacteria group bacterium]
MQTNEKYEKVGKLIKGIRTCMFVTITQEGEMISRPMATQDIEFNGSIWFMTSKESNKAKEIQHNNSVALTYADGNGITFVSLTGKAKFVEDKEKIKEYWNPFLKAWFEGPEDPNITLIEVMVSRAEYWDNKGGKIGALADMAIGAVTGKTNMLDEHEIITF